MNFSDDSDLEDLVSVEAQLAEGSKRQGTTSRGRSRARKGPSVKTNSVATSGSAPGLSGRSRRVKKVASGHCEEPGPEMMRTIPEELTDNQMEMSFEILRGSDGEDSASGVRARVEGRSPFFLRLPWGQNTRNNWSQRWNRKKVLLLALGRDPRRESKGMAGRGNSIEKLCRLPRWEDTRA